MTEENIERRKAKSKGFADLGIPVGATLAFRKNPAVTCKTADGKNKVEYQGKTYCISGLAKELMNTPVSGYHAFKYNGVLLAKLAGGGPEAAETGKPAETAPDAPPAAVTRTIPLPGPSEPAARA